MGTKRLQTTPRAHWLGLVALAVLAAGACSEASTPPSGVTPPTGTAEPMPDVDLIFVGGASHGPNIYGFRHRDGAIFSVTDVPSSYWGVNLSPTGGALAVAAVREGCRTILSIDLDTRVETAVSDPVLDSCVYSPRWSPDGSSIVYSNLRGGYHLVMVNADGEERRVLVPSEGPSAFVFAHGWHPDGRVIFHRQAPGSDLTAHVVNPDGSGVEPLFGREGDVTPQWSPTGSRVAFVREVDDQRSVWIADADGSNAVRISDPTSHAALGYATAAVDHVKDFWSPDGEWIAMTRDSAFHTAVDVVRADGSDHRRLASFRAQTLFMGWTKEGRVSFRSDITGTTRLYTAWPDGTGLQEVVLPVPFLGNAIWRRAFVGAPH